MIHVFANRVRFCFFRLLFLLAGVSVTLPTLAQIDPGDTYCSNFMYGLSENDFSVTYDISLNSYNNGWEPDAYTYINVGRYRCEMIHKPQMKVCAVYEGTATVECAVGYAVTGRRFRGTNPWYGQNNSQDSSLNPSNPYLRSNGTLLTGSHCTEGEHLYTPFPKGYRYIPFDGFKYLSTDAWSPCLYDAASPIAVEDIYGIYSSEIKYYTWSSSYYSSTYNPCKSLSEDCLYVTMFVTPENYIYSDHPFIYGLSEPFYVRCPPNSQFSPVHGACYVIEADELLAGTGISDSDLYGQPGNGDKMNVNFNSVNLLSQLSKSGINQCPPPLKTTFKGQSITFFDYSDACQMLGDYVKPFVLLLGSFISIAILLGISTASVSANEG